MQLTKLVVPVLVGVSAVGIVGLTTASAADHSCGPAHRYINAKSATVTAHRVVITGKRSTLVCGGEDDSHYSDGGPLTVKLLKTATVKVWNAYADPSQGRRTIAAIDLPHWLKKNAGEPIYKIHGPSGGVTKLVEQWHP